MALFHIEFWITIGKGNGVGLIDVGVQIRYTWTRDAHVISESQIAAL